MAKSQLAALRLPYILRPLSCLVMWHREVMAQLENRCNFKGFKWTRLTGLNHCDSSRELALFPLSDHLFKLHSTQSKIGNIWLPVLALLDFGLWPLATFVSFRAQRKLVNARNLLKINRLEKKSGWARYWEEGGISNALRYRNQRVSIHLKSMIFSECIRVF